MGGNIGVPANKRAVLIINSLPNKSKSGNGLVERFLNKHSFAQMTGERGLEAISRFLDEELSRKTKVGERVSETSGASKLNSDRREIN